MEPRRNVRIGTWNMQGKWTESHAAVLNELDCDVVLLTEVPPAVSIGGFELRTTAAMMGTRPPKAWAGILSRLSAEALPDPHPATAAICAGDQLYFSSVLPWLTAGPLWPWGSPNHADRMRATVDHLAEQLNGRLAVWGGDWNQPLVGGIRGFSRAAQNAVLEAVERCGMHVPTAEFGGLRGQATIDQIAVPADWSVIDGDRFPTPGLSDHEAAYWIEAIPSPRL